MPEADAFGSTGPVGLYTLPVGVNVLCNVAAAVAATSAANDVVSMTMALVMEYPSLGAIPSAQPSVSLALLRKA